MDIIVYAALILLVTHLALGIILWLRVRKLYSYPGLLGFPVIGNLYYFYRTLFIFTIDGMQRYIVPIMNKFENNGLFFHWLRGNTIVLVTRPEVVKKLIFHPNLQDKPDSLYGGFCVFLDGPLSSLRADDEWKLKKKEYNISLKKNRVDNDYYNTFIKGAEKIISMILEGSPSGVYAHAVCASVAQDVSSKTLLGYKTSIWYRPEGLRLLTRLNIFSSYVAANAYIIKALNFLIIKVLEVFYKKLTYLRKLAVELIDNQLKLNLPLQGQPLSIQLASRVREHNGSDQALLKEILELFITSGQSIAISLSNMINFLAILPDIQEKAWQEQYQIFGNDSRDPTIEDLNQMQFLDRFIKEGFRHLGGTFVARWATADINIDGITIPRNTPVIYPLKYISFDPKLWENPNAFDPDRFLEESDLQKYSFLPFGFGIRICPGMYYATVLMKVTLSKILRSVKLRPVDEDFRFEDIKHKCYLLSEIENAPKLQAEKRK